MRLKLFVFVFAFFGVSINAQDIPQHISYTRIYDFLDELAGEGIIDINTVAKPYSRQYIAKKLQEASQTDGLSTRQNSEVNFFLNEFALELNQLPSSHLTITQSELSKAALIQPAFHYLDTVFRARVTPLLGMHVTNNGTDNIIKRWYGAELQLMLGKHLSVYGSLRDISIVGDLLASPQFLNDYPGLEYKESALGGDYSDSRGGIKYAWAGGSVGLVKDNIVWGEHINGSNILSGRTPSFPMLSLYLKPSKWFEMNYIHGWLVSNVVDSTNFYIDNQNNRMYRMANKFIAANLFTFTPISRLSISLGNSIIYAEQNVHPAYFIPIAFYKSIDHTLTKGLGLENQNSQVFFTISSRNIKHLHLFSSVFFDEVSFSRFRPSSAEKNPLSFKLGGSLINFPIQNLSLMAEYTKNTIITYKHSIPTLSWASNGYNLGSYLGDNAQELFIALRYKPLRGLDLQLSYLQAEHGNEYSYIRRPSAVIRAIISEPFMKDITWTNQTLSFKGQYEILNNAYAILSIAYSNIQGHDLSSSAIPGENVARSAQEYLDMFTPKYLQGNKFTVNAGFSFGF